MAIASSRCLVLAVLVVLGILVFGKQGVTGQCGGSIPGVVAQCAQYVLKPGPKIPPSQDCCKQVKVLDVPCVCNKYVTPDLEKIVSVEKVIFVATTCGLTLKPGFKCGNFTIPPA
ncbi:hypothetical protein SLE2022_355490 [Rubroshorea leprosula]